MNSFSINFERVSFAYPGRDFLFQDLNLNLPGNQAILLTGENGSGKSTLAGLAASVLSPLSGKVSYPNLAQPNKKKPALYQKLAFLQQNIRNNLAGVNPREDLSLWLQGSDGSKQEKERFVQWALEQWKLQDKAEKPVWSMSTGELKSLALAGISLFPKRYWILDEPMAGLDSEHLDIMLTLLQTRRKLKDGLLVVSHNAEPLLSCVDAVLHLNMDGSLKWER